MNSVTPIRASGRFFSTDDIALIRDIIQAAGSHSRAEIARRVCRRLEWRNVRGDLKAMSCRVALLRMHREGLIELPPPRNGNGNGKPLSKRKLILSPQPALSCLANELHNLELALVQSEADSALWNGLIDQYHYLGYKPLPGSQLRYLIRHQGGILGAIGWGAAAWKVAARDKWIGWTPTAREAHLCQVINNARFLILPWVRCKNLASKVLAMSERCLPADFELRYGIKPVLLETFVEKDRFAGTCYRAANWQYLGQTQGRGKCDSTHQALLPVKSLFVRPLTPAFRNELVTVP